MRTRGLAFLLSIMLSLLVVAPEDLRAQPQCAPIHPQYSGTNAHSTVNLIYGGQSTPLSQGVAMWNSTCGSGIPDFVIRSQGQAGRINITVVFTAASHPQGCGVNDCGCSEREMQNGQLIGGTVRISTHAVCPNPGTTVAHELGHVLGLTHTEDPACSNRIMYKFSGGTQTVQSDDCGAVDDLWLTQAEATPDGEGEPEPVGPGGGGGSPIIVDLDRDQFHLTGLDDPVAFDIDADGDAETISWTASETLDAFLWLDRNDNGVVDSGAELFGNHTPLIDGSTAANGYIPLAEFDLVAMGGNGNGFIDADDVVYHGLRLWIDWNHTGISEPGESLTLSEAGVTRIDLEYRATRRRDQHGNYFRYVSRAWILVNGHERRAWTSDVFFVVGE